MEEQNRSRRPRYLFMRLHGQDRELAAAVVGWWSARSSRGAGQERHSWR